MCLYVLRITEDYNIRSNFSLTIFLPQYFPRNHYGSFAQIERAASTTTLSLNYSPYQFAWSPISPVDYSNLIIDEALTSRYKARRSTSGACFVPSPFSCNHGVTCSRVEWTRAAARSRCVIQRRTTISHVSIILLYCFSRKKRFTRHLCAFSYVSLRKKIKRAEKVFTRDILHHFNMFFSDRFSAWSWYISIKISIRVWIHVNNYWEKVVSNREFKWSYIRRLITNIYNTEKWHVMSANVDISAKKIDLNLLQKYPINNVVKKQDSLFIWIN